MLSAPAGTRAAHPLVTDDAGTIGRGGRQLELSAAASRDLRVQDGVLEGEDAGEGGLALGVGLRDDLDVVASVATVWSRAQQDGGAFTDRSGLGDVAVDVKWRALEVGKLAVALRPGFTLPTGDATRRLGTGRVCYGLLLIASYEVGPVAFHANVGYRRDDYVREEDREASRLHRLRASAAASAAIAPSLHLVADVGAETNPDRASSTWPAYALGGLILAARQNLDLDLGLKAGLSAPETDLEGLLGLTWRF